MRKPLIYFVGIAVLMVIFALLIYPTPYRFLNIEGGQGGSLPVQVNVFTGKATLYTVNGREVLENGKWIEE